MQHAIARTCAPEYVPAGQSMQSSDKLAESLLDHVPAGHAEHWLAC